jgi:hypothetical protein
MATYLYCILRPATSKRLPEGLRGIGETAVRALSHASLAPLEAWIGTVDETDLRATGATLAAQALLHNEVVSAALAIDETPVPARFGSRFADDATCVRELARRKGDLLHTLDRVAGAVEMPVLVVAPTHQSTPVRPDSREAGSGRRYLELLRQNARHEEEERARLEAQAERVSRAVGQIVRAEVRSADRRGVLSIAHLVSREALASYRTAIEAVPREPGVKLIFGEVRAPYSFAELRSAQSGHDSGSPGSDE